MKFGDKLRQYRQEKGLTQPELADAMGIEQSYLSKLENGKSLPSNDVLNRILDVFTIGVEELLDGLDQGVRNQLRQIPDVADHLRREKEQLIGNRRRWLIVSAALVALGAGLIYAGWANLFFSDIVYNYESRGIVRDGEPKELFDNIPIPAGASREESDRIRNEILSRLDEDFLQTTRYSGHVFNVPVDGGSRTYYLRDRWPVDPWQNKAVTFVGVLMLMFGAIGLVLDQKLARRN